jgi:UrcA family protein
MKNLVVALSAACLLALPAAVSAEGRQPVSFKTSVEGVNLLDPVAVEQFRNRMTREIAAMCEPEDRVGGDGQPDWRCRREMNASLDAALRTAAENNAVRVAAN